MKVIKNVREYGGGKATCFNCDSELEYEETDIINKDMVFGV